MEKKFKKSLNDLIDSLDDLIDSYYDPTIDLNELRAETIEVLENMLSLLKKESVEK